MGLKLRPSLIGPHNVPQEDKIGGGHIVEVGLLSREYGNNIIITKVTRFHNGE